VQNFEDQGRRIEGAVIKVDSAATSEILENERNVKKSEDEEAVTVFPVAVGLHVIRQPADWCFTKLPAPGCKGGRWRRMLANGRRKRLDVSA
jgi:hypothetical protein